MEGMNAIFQGINTLNAMEARGKNSRLADMQMQQIQADQAEKAAVAQRYNELASAFKDSGGDVNALAPLVKDRAGFKAMASFMTDYQATADGMQRGQEATAKRAMQNFQVASGHVEKALSAQKGSDEWVSHVENAAAVAPFPMKVSGYDPQTDTFEAMEASPLNGWESKGQRIPANDVLATLKRVKDGTMRGKDGSLFNREWQNAQVMFDIDRKTKNPAMLADDSHHIILKGKDGSTVTAIPQLAENPAEGFHYLVADPQKGLVAVPSLDQFLKAGFVPTTQKQLNKDADLEIDRAKFGIDQQRLGLSAANLGESVRQHNYQRERDARVEGNDAMRSANSVLDDIRSRQVQILRNYVDYPENIDWSNPNAVMQIGATTKRGIEVLKQREKAGDATAKQDLAAIQEMDQSYNEIATVREGRARQQLGLGMRPAAQPQQPQQVAQPQPEPQAQAKPAAKQQLPQGAVQDATGAVFVPAKEGEPGAKRAKNGNFYKPYQQ